MRRRAALVSAVLLTAAACSGGDDDGTRPPPGGDDETVEWTSCTNEEDGWTADHPAEWQVNDGAEVAQCSLFAPESVELPESSGLEVPSDIAVQVRMQKVVTSVGEDFLDDPFVEVTDQRQRHLERRPPVRVGRRRRRRGGGRRCGL